MPIEPTAAYDIVSYDPDLKGQIADLQRHLWRGDPGTNIAYLEWKYEQNPYWKTPLIYLATSGPRVVAMRGMFGSAWEAGAGGERFAIPCADDLLIAPEHRNRGLATLITRTALDDLARRGYDCVFSLSPGPVTLVTSLVSGWRPVGAMRPLERRAAAGLLERIHAGVSRVPILWRHADAIGRLRARRSPFGRLDHAGAYGRRLRGREIRLAQAAAPLAMADLVRRLGHDGRIRHVRDERYLEWRFRNPLHEYRFLFSGDDELAGYLVLQAYRLDRSRGVNIVDWEGKTREVRADLLRAAIEWGRFDKLTIWTATLSPEALALLSAAAFVPARIGRWSRPPSVLAAWTRLPTPTSDPTLGGRRVLDVTEWDIRMLYSMAG